MAKVLGVGGVFFKTPRRGGPEGLVCPRAGLRADRLGRREVSAPAGWGPPPGARSPADTEHFKPSGSDFMVNYVVDDLDGLLDHVRGEGVEVLERQEMDRFGRFAWIMDPAGNKIELWEPAPPPAPPA